jgi:PncC family amidohydrolase
MTDHPNNHHTDLPIKYKKDLFIVLFRLITEIGTRLQLLDETISVAESVTSGFLQLSFSQMKDASQFFTGGITAYTLDEKVSLLKVDRDEASFCDCVSPNIADTMAINIAKIFKTDWSIAVTGYATPVEESNQQLFAFFSIAYKDNIIISKKLQLHSQTKSLYAQLYYSECILNCFRIELDKRNKEKN